MRAFVSLCLYVCVCVCVCVRERERERERKATTGMDGRSSRGDYSNGGLIRVRFFLKDEIGMGALLCVVLDSVKHRILVLRSIWFSD